MPVLLRRSLWLVLLVYHQNLLAAAPSVFDKALQYMQDGDYAKAFCLWEPMANNGYADAQYHLGWLYANGLGLNVDPDMAVYWWQQAADRGNLDAQFAIGISYLTGEGKKPSREEAFSWFYQAAKGGHEDAREIIKRLVIEADDDYYSQYPGLKTADWLQQSVMVLGDIVNVRDGPGTQHAIVAQANNEQILTSVRQIPEWVEVIIDEETGATGWIYAKLVKTLE